MGTSTLPLPQDNPWPLWGELRPGRHGVGFESFVMCDYSRRYRYPSENGPEAEVAVILQKRPPSKMSNC